MPRSTLFAAVTLAVASPVHTWDRYKGDWVAEALLTFSAAEEATVDPQSVIAKADQELMTLSYHQGCEKVTLKPGTKRTCPVFLYSLTKQSGRPQPKRFTFKLENEVTAEPLVIATTGLEIGAPAKAKVQETPRPAHGHVHPKPAWGVRLYVKMKNPTKAPVRVLLGSIEATLDDGTERYWGDGAGYSGAQEIAPGAEADGDLTLMFVNKSDKPPRSMTLRYKGSSPVKVSLD